MDPRNLPFNALIVGPTNSGKTQYLLTLLRGPKNTTYEGFVDRDPHIFMIACLRLQGRERPHEPAGQSRV